MTAVRRSAKSWVPDRQEVIWIDGPAQAERYPFLVLSPRAFNDRTSLVVGLPMSAAPQGADNPFAVAVGAATGRRAARPNYVLCHQPESFDWRARGGRRHPAGRLPDAAFAESCQVLNQILQLGP